MVISNGVVPQHAHSCLYMRAEGPLRSAGMEVLILSQRLQAATALLFHHEKCAKDLDRRFAPC